MVRRSFYEGERVPGTALKTYSPIQIQMPERTRNGDQVPIANNT